MVLVLGKTKKAGSGSRPPEDQESKEVSTRRRFGQRGEELALKHLKKEGYKILEKNFKSPIGEIDIVAREGRTIVFVEVKARSSDDFGAAKWAVDVKKQRKLSLLALDYLKRKYLLEQSARFDVVAIDGVPGQETIELIRNAFDLAY
jgi:putative endonuclease